MARLSLSSMTLKLNKIYTFHKYINFNFLNVRIMTKSIGYFTWLKRRFSSLAKNLAVLQLAPKG